MAPSPRSDGLIRAAHECSQGGRFGFVELKTGQLTSDAAVL
ncbi:hypothetical protein [Streptomyces sp. NBC_00554]|nr:hypothetical protein OG256_01550 [Streptomyces sp. NBC_00564]WUC54926.1 hypothetical protein OG266_43920 [Streptomyces sp. NBC_00554]